MRKGFYEELDSLKRDYEDSDFGFLENEDIFADINAYNFLHGFCDTFALKLSEIFGYEKENIVIDGKLIHSYCKTMINGKLHFVDVRGITDDYEEFIDEFSDWLEYFDEIKYPCEGTVNYKKFTEFKNEEYSLRYSKAAEKLIKDYKNYYSF